MNAEIKYGSLLPAVTQVVQEVGAFIRHERLQFKPEDIEFKQNEDLVSYVDRSAEDQLQKALAALIPDSGFINEESGISNAHSFYKWIIDPLDGTTNFIHNIPIYSISVALMAGPEVVLGCVLEVTHDELLAAAKGMGATCNEKPIHISKIPEMKDALIAFGSPHGSSDYADLLLGVLKKLMRRSRGMRRLGSAAVDLAFTAIGRFDAYFEAKLNPWDVAAGALIVQEAGGIVTDFNGGNDYIFGRQIIAGSPAIQQQLLSIVQETLKEIS